jgi:hypothetical protein
MKYLQEHEPACKDIPKLWHERWRLLREFTERWYGVPMKDVGGRKEEVVAVETRLGLPLPPSIQEWIAFSIDLGSDFSYLLRDCYQVVELPENSAISLMIAGESDLYWVVKKSDLEIADPPVDLYSRMYEGFGPEFEYLENFAPQVTSFVFKHMATYLGACRVDNPIGKPAMNYYQEKSVRSYLRYMTDVFLGTEHALPTGYMG